MSEETIATAAPVSGSTLYQRVIAPSDDPLMHQVWDATPWMLDVLTGSVATTQSRAVIDWLWEKLGRDAWPIHNIPGKWHRGGVTIDGWTWIGFQTEQMMTDFANHWPDKVQY